MTTITSPNVEKILAGALSGRTWTASNAAERRIASRKAFRDLNSAIDRALGSRVLYGWLVRPAWYSDGSTKRRDVLAGLHAMLRAASERHAAAYGEPLFASAPRVAADAQTVASLQALLR